MTTINNKLPNLAIYGYIWLLYMVVLLVDLCFLIRTNTYVMKRSENGTPFSAKHDCNWLDLDKVSLKLASKNLVGSKLKIKTPF